MFSSEELFDAEGLLSGHLSGYEVRPQQFEMVKAVEEAIFTSRDLIVEAGTGVGKSLAYLVPFVKWALEEDKKVVISTYTKALQNQLFVKDLPFLKKVLGEDLRYALCMGSENYLCLRKAEKGGVSDLFDSKTKKRQVERILNWMRATETGLLTDMDFVPENSVWSRFSRESDMCMGRKCSSGDGCFYRKARAEQMSAHILITNHFLLFADMVSGARVLPDFHGLVLDEAHTLEDIATKYFGREFSTSGLKYLIEFIRETCSAGKTGRGIIDDAVGERIEVETALDKVQKVSEFFSKKAGEVFGEEDQSADLDISPFENIGISRGLLLLSSALMSLSDELKDPEEKEVIKTCSERCLNTAESIDFIFDKENQEYVYWVDVKAWRSGINHVFHAAPVDIDRQMKEYLFDKVCPVVLTSATLISSGRKNDFTFIKGRLGLDDPLELSLDSPFDYKKNVLMYLPDIKSDPAKELNAFKQEIKKGIIEIYDIMKGRMFALFTSYSMLNSVANEILKERADIEVLRQGELPRYVLLDVFKNSRNKILMGTTTFWQGVDVPGDSLECVIITKLPFSVPSDPVNAARIDSLRRQGLNPFNEYQVPQAIIMFKQGFGRLIRSKSDRGIVAVFDPRVKTRHYGKAFINSLPECERSHKIESIRSFLTDNQS